MALQHTHSSTPIEKNKHSIIVLCDGVNSPANIGGLFRVCDAFGVSELIFCGAHIDLSSNRLLRTARGTQNSVAYKVSENDSLTELTQLKTNGAYAIALELAKNSIPLKKLVSTLTISKNSIIEPTLVLILGNEKNGVGEAILSHTDENAYIPMHGQNSSMNVVQAAAIALYALT